MESVVNECSNSIVNFKKIMECANSNLGNKLFYSMGLSTNNMRPRLNWVPWLVVNGYHSESLQNEAEYNLVGYLCKRFKTLNNQVNYFMC